MPSEIIVEFPSPLTDRELRELGYEPLVRCKDCQYLEPSLNSDWSWCCYFDSKVRGDDFCSHGERREDAD